jgi:hypothetical protein
MSIVIESVVGASATAITELIKEWSTLRETKQKEELETPEWQKLENAYLKHLMWRFDYPQKVFGQQILANWIITIVVLGLVISGLVFSFLQLKYAIALGDMSTLNSTIQIETAGKISISSSIVGAITLVISLVFFALYLKYVFQIKHTHPPHVSLQETDAEMIINRKNHKNVHSNINHENIEIVKVNQG